MNNKLYGIGMVTLSLIMGAAELKATNQANIWEIIEEGEINEEGNDLLPQQFSFRELKEKFFNDLTVQKESLIHGILSNIVGAAIDLAISKHAPDQDSKSRFYTTDRQALKEIIEVADDMSTSKNVMYNKEVNIRADRGREALEIYYSINVNKLNNKEKFGGTHIGESKPRISGNPFTPTNRVLLVIDLRNLIDNIDTTHGTVDLTHAIATTFTPVDPR